MISSDAQTRDMGLFWGCFVALVATAFGFILRSLLLPVWGEEFNLSNTQLGEIAGVGLWPFAISIVLFSLFIDKWGYRNAMIFAWVCQAASAVITIFADGYWMLWIGTFVLALGNGAVEAFINPVIATMFSREKTKWLNILHAGWPGGLVAGGVLALLMGADTSWQLKIGLILIPVVIYGIMLWRREFPVHERVAAGVTYREMIEEVGMGGTLIIGGLIAFQLGTVFGWPTWLNVALTAAMVSAVGWYTRSFGRPLYIFLLLVMILVATTELGTDSWITDLMTPEMERLGMQAGWVLVYTSFIMMVLRFYAGSVVHRLNPLGLLSLASAIAAVGLLLLSKSVGAMILVAATVYGIGKAFFWPTMLGLAAEQFPKGGALTLNVMGGTGMIGVGIVGAVILGFVQDKAIEKELIQYDRQHQTALHEKCLTEEKKSILGNYRALDLACLEQATEAEKEAITKVQNDAKKTALRTVAIFPLIMLACFLGLWLWFRSRGGYKPVVLARE